MISEESSNSRWLEENVNDFSLNSLLGHLDEINASRDILVTFNIRIYKFLTKIFNIYFTFVYFWSFLGSFF